MDIQAIRQAVIDRVKTHYPASNPINAEKFSKGIKFSIDNWFGDAFAWVVKQEFNLNETEYEEARKELFYD